jgi:hypothetical protein
MTGDVAARLWDQRTRALRVALDSYRRRGLNCAWSKDLAHVLRIPESAVRRMGLSMIDRCQIQGAVVKYSVGLWMWERAPIRKVD